jgi:hypothetical protein
MVQCEVVKARRIIWRDFICETEESGRAGDFVEIWAGSSSQVR